MSKKTNDLTEPAVIETPLSDTPILVQKLQILYLPSRPGMARGHLMRMCIEVQQDGTEKVLWKRRTEHDDTAAMNMARDEVIKTAAQKGLSWGLYENPYTSYRYARDNFERNPLTVMQRVMAPWQRSDGNTAEQESAF